MTRPYLFTVSEATKLIRLQFPSMELRHIMSTNTKTPMQRCFQIGSLIIPRTEDEADHNSILQIFK
eukprot:scaffold7087_cov76-Cyclotella_meneghiniana.AAC.1